MKWWHYLNAALAALVVGQFILVAWADCSSPTCGTVSYCSDPCSACKGEGGPIPASAIATCEVVGWTGPFDCCCTLGDDCCQYRCYTGKCSPCGGDHTYADNGNMVESARCEENHCKVRV